MDLAGDVAKLVLKEMERDDGESPFFLMLKNFENNNFLTARGCFIKGVLHFMVFEKATFRFNLKTADALCEVFKAKFQEFSVSRARGGPIMSTFITIMKDNESPYSSGETVIRFKIDDANISTDLRKKIDTYIDICVCNYAK